MAFPVVATSAVTFGTALGSGVAANMPAGITAGDLLLLFTALDSTSGNTWPTPSGWTKFLNPQFAQELGSNPAAVNGLFCAKIASGGDTATVTFPGDTAQDYVIMVLRVTGHGCTLPTDIKYDFNEGSSAAPDPPSVDALSTQDWLWLEVFGADDDDDTATYWSTSFTGIAQQQSASSTSSCLLAAAYRQFNTQTLDPGAMAMAATEEWWTITIAVPPVSAAKAPPLFRTRRTRRELIYY